MADRINHFTKEASRHRRSWRFLHLRTQSPALQIPRRIQKVQRHLRLRRQLPPRQEEDHSTRHLLQQEFRRRIPLPQLELKAVKDGAASYAALKKKAELYEKLVKGELSDEEEKEKYCVDFFRKGVEQEDAEKGRSGDSNPAASAVGAAEGDGGNIDDASELFNTNFVGLGRNGGAFDNDEHKRFVS